jgi:hypothetical protein
VALQGRADGHHGLARPQVGTVADHGGGVDVLAHDDRGHVIHEVWRLAQVTPGGEDHVAGAEPHDDDAVARVEAEQERNGGDQVSRCAEGERCHAVRVALTWMRSEDPVDDTRVIHRHAQ